MKNLIYLFAILVMKSLISCEKRTATPATTTHTTTGNNYIGDIFTIAGNGLGGFSGDGGPATAADLNGVAGVAVDGSGNIFISDGNNRIRKVNTVGIISTYAGIGILSHGGFSGDGGPATAAELYYPMGIAVDGSGNVYFADYNNQRIRKINANGIISTIAGNGYGTNGSGGFSGDGGPATLAELSIPFGVTVDGSGKIYISGGGCRVRMVNTLGIISTFAGNGSGGFSGDGGPATAAELFDPQGVTTDGSGNVYIADRDENIIRKVTTNGIISTYAGNGYNAPADGGYSGDGGTATAAELFNPTDVAVDGFGNVYISDEYNFRIRMVNASGVISTIAGNGTYGYTGDGGPAIASEIGHPIGISLDGSGNLYIADENFSRIRKVYK